jgi:predicted dehydrogenase
VRVLVIGLGGVGQRHVRNLRAILGDYAEILAWRVRRSSRVVTSALQADESRDVVREYGIRVFDTLESALSERPEVAFICNPTRLHVAPTLACLRAGCDVFLEKPVSDDLAGVAELKQAAEQNHRLVMVGYQLRFHPCFLALQRALRERIVGNILAVRATVGEYLPGWHPYEDYRGTYAARSDLGGGVIVTQIHEFDYLYALFGVPERLFSLSGHWSALEIDVEDVASTLMQFQFEGRPLAVHLQQDYLQRPLARSCEVVGDRGKIIMDLTAPSITRYSSEGMIAEFVHFKEFDRNQLFLDELRSFLRCLETRSKPVVDLNDGVQSLRMALAARASGTSGEVIKLTDPDQ